MKIKETYIRHNGLVNIGQLSLHINVSLIGSDHDDNLLSDQASMFGNVVVMGKPFKQTADVVKLIKKINKKNPDTTIQIHTNGIRTPTGLSTNKSISYVTNIQLKNSDLPFDRRIIEKSLNWYSKMGASFVFNVNTVDDIDEVNLLVQEYNISKHQVNLSPINPSKLDWCISRAKTLQYNIAPPFGEWLWPREEVTEE